MKVLAVSSSPRSGGNSETLCDAFLKGTAAAGYETEKICLRQKNWRRVKAAEPAGLRGFLSCLPGAEEKGILYGCGTWDKGDVLNIPVKEEAYQTGKKTGKEN